MSEDPTKEELQHEVFHNRRMAEERTISDGRYAEKRVQTLVYGGAALMLIAVLTAIVNAVVTKQ
jgi:hypothetical protein